MTLPPAMPPDSPASQPTPPRLDNTRLGNTHLGNTRPDDTPPRPETMQEHTPTGDLFRPDGFVWHPVSPDYVKVEAISAAISWGILAAASIVPCAIWTPWWVAALVGAFWLFFLPWRVWASRRRARSWRYALAENDLLISHGILFKELTVVPYGRMQVVEVGAGPILSRFGLAGVDLKTAASMATTNIPGLPSDEANRLREELSRLGEEQAVAL